MKTKNRIMLAVLLSLITGSVLPAENIFAEEVTAQVQTYNETVDEKESTDAENNEKDNTSDEENASQELKGVDGFVSRLYNKVLGRNSDPNGFAGWTSNLNSHSCTAAQAAYGFVFSREYSARNTSDRDFVTMLYNVMMDREPDPNGLNGWLKVLDDGVSRKFVLKNFIKSAEFTHICENFGIECGDIETTENRDKNSNVTAFVQRLYKGFLGRKADVNGLNAWTGELISRKKNACDVINGFIFSREFKNSSVSNEAYTDILYRTILGREPDTTGRKLWADKLNDGYTREFVLRGFTASREFSELCSYYTVVRGNTVLNGWQKEDGGKAYYQKDGTKITDRLETISGYTYYFDKNGYLGNGWYNIGGKNRYVGSGLILPDNGTDWGTAFSSGNMMYPSNLNNKMNIPMQYQFMYTKPVCWLWGTPKTVKSSGCGAASASMVIEYYTGRKDLDPQTLFEWAHNNGQYYGSGLAEYTITNFMKLADLKGTWLKKDPSDTNNKKLQESVTNALKEGKPVIPLMLEGYFTTGGHYIVLAGVADNGYYYVNDPNDSSRSCFIYKPELVVSQAKCFMICEK